MSDADEGWWCDEQPAALFGEHREFQDNAFEPPGADAADVRPRLSSQPTLNAILLAVHHDVPPARSAANAACTLRPRRPAAASAAHLLRRSQRHYHQELQRRWTSPASGAACIPDRLTRAPFVAAQEAAAEASEHRRTRWVAVELPHHAQSRHSCTTRDAPHPTPPLPHTRRAPPPPPTPVDAPHSPPLPASPQADSAEPSHKPSPKARRVGRPRPASERLAASLREEAAAAERAALQVREGLRVVRRVSLQTGDAELRSDGVLVMTSRRQRASRFPPTTTSTSAASATSAPPP